MSRSAIVGDAVEHCARLCPGRPALAYCCNIKHSELVAQRFVEGGGAPRMSTANHRRRRAERLLPLWGGAISMP